MVLFSFLCVVTLSGTQLYNSPRIFLNVCKIPALQLSKACSGGILSAVSSNPGRQAASEMKQTAAFSPLLIKNCSKLPALLQIFTSSAFNNLFSIALLTYYLPGSQHSYLYAVSLQLHIPTFMPRLLCCLLTRVHYRLKQEGCSGIKHVLLVAARRAEPITGGKDGSVLPGSNLLFSCVTFDEERAPTWVDSRRRRAEYTTSPGGSAQAPLQSLPSAGTFLTRNRVICI